MNLTDLPTDIIVLLFPYLSAPDFLALTSLTKAFLSFRQEPTFWRRQTTSTFRIPHQPLLADDGPRWQWLYKSLLTQTHIYTWGNNQKLNLGHGAQHVHGRNRIRHVRPTVNERSIGWPLEVENISPTGVVVDVQCGGWSTVILNSIGQLFMAGVLNGETFQRPTPELTQLHFPPAYPRSEKTRYEPTTAIRQYSVGRSHVLGVSDSGKIWEWANHVKPGQLVKFISVDIHEEPSSSPAGNVRQVVAGWAGSSAYINGIGIVFWERLPEYNESEDTDGFLTESLTVPGTCFKRSWKNVWAEDSLPARIGEVVSYVILDHHIVFITDVNKVYVYPARLDIRFDLEPVELFTFTQNSPDFRIQDIQGSFRNFGIFSKNGAVLLGDSTLLDAFMMTAGASSSPSSSMDESRLQPKIIPALQNASIISLAFGDYHYHALHANGTISSYGVESQACGALGLGPDYVAVYRGVYYRNNMTANGTLTVPPWSSTGRRTVWFEQERFEWIRSMRGISAKGTESLPVAELLTQGSLEWCQVYGEWFEREGAVWHEGPKSLEGTQSANDEDKGAYFALKVTAAGWHSGALVLVDQDKADRVRTKWKLPASPKLEPTLAGADVKPGFNAALSEAGASNKGAEQPIAEQLIHGVQRLGGTLVGAGRTFLGLTTRDDAAAGADAAAGHGKKEGKTTWAWEGRGLPRLRGIGGAVMPGESEIAEWRGGEPDWGLAQTGASTE